MGAKKSISNSFIVNTVDDPVGLVAQYCATATPESSSQIHTSFQTGDLYMRTRTTEETFSGYVDPSHPWNRIVGESGDETDYTFAISSKETTTNASTPPSDVYTDDWEEAPMATTSLKPFLWSRVQKKSWNESTQQYVVDSTSYIRLTGEPSNSYEVETTVGSITIPSGSTTATLTATCYFYIKVGSATRSSYQCSYAVYSRTGTTYALFNSLSGTSTSVSISSKTVSSTYDAIVVYMFSSPYSSNNPESVAYLAKKEILVKKNGDQGAKGDDAPTALASPDKISIPCNTNGSVTAQVTKTLTFSMRVGSYAASNIRVTPPSTFPTGVSYSESSGTLTIGTSATASGISSGVTFTVIGAYNNKDYTATVTVALIGAGTGQRGKMGRMYYYDDKWSSSKTYTSTDSQAPYVLASNGEFYMLDNAGNGGSNVTSTNQDPTNSTYGNGKPWTIMYSDQKYYIAEAVFSNFAKLGSGVFSKDWMLSQYGYHSQEILSSSQSISSAIGTWNQIPNQLAAISTTKGMEYTILIEGKATSSNQVQVSVFYKPTGSSTYNYQGRDFYAITSTTSTQYVFSFKAEYDGQVTFYASGYGTISKIINTQQGDYTNFSPSFPNADTVNIPMYAGIPTNTWRIPNQNTYYLVADNLYTFTAYSPAASGVITIEVFNADSESTPKLHSSTFTIASNASSGTLSFRPSVSCNAGIRAKTTSGSTNRSINNINIKPDNPFIPMVAVDWFSGYAHFGGDKIRFNPDGSGFVAGGKFYWDSLGNGSIAEDNINWDTEGNVTISGTIYAEDGEFNGTVHANDGYFKGTVTTVSLYQQYQDLSETQTLDISKGTYVIAEAVPDIYSSIVITIPSASNSQNVTLTIVSPVANSDPNYGYNFPKIQSTVGGFYTKKSHSGSYRIRSFKTAANIVVKLHSIGNSWFLDTEEDYLTDVTAW